MEENPKPRSRAFLVACVLLGIVTGFFAALLGATMTSHRGIFDLPERIVLNAAWGGPIVGAGCGFTVWILQPRRDTWEGCLGWSVLLAADVVGGGLLTGLLFYLMARLMRG